MVCIGDLHGNLAKLCALWVKLEAALGAAGLADATVVFLGDFCDRGPDTRGVIDWLIEAERARPAGCTRFIAGNHDFGFACYLDCLDEPPAGFDVEATLPAAYTTGFYEWPVGGRGMHYQGRRWGEGSVYNSAETFASYGVPFARTREAREALRAAVPQAHKDFLRRLPWVCELDVPWQSFRQLVCVHAGLRVDAPAAPQLAALRARDVSAVLLQPATHGRIEAFSARGDVIGAHPDLERAGALLVSGHHGLRRGVGGKGGRIILDHGGGRPDPALPLEAVVLPERLLVGSLD